MPAEGNAGNVRIRSKWLCPNTKEIVWVEGGFEPKAEDAAREKFGCLRTCNLNCSGAKYMGDSNMGVQ